jgi:hypothetical protein
MKTGLTNAGTILTTLDSNEESSPNALIEKGVAKGVSEKLGEKIVDTKVKLFENWLGNALGNTSNAELNEMFKESTVHLSSSDRDSEKGAIIERLTDELREHLTIGTPLSNMAADYLKGGKRADMDGGELLFESANRSMNLDALKNAQKKFIIKSGNLGALIASTPLEKSEAKQNLQEATLNLKSARAELEEAKNDPAYQTDSKVPNLEINYKNSLADIDRHTAKIKKQCKKHPELLVATLAKSPDLDRARQQRDRLKPSYDALMNVKEKDATLARAQTTLDEAHDTAVGLGVTLDSLAPPSFNPAAITTPTTPEEVQVLKELASEIINHSGGEISKAVKDPSFKKIMKELRPNYQAEGQVTTDTPLQQAFQAARNKLGEELRALDTAPSAPPESTGVKAKKNGTDSQRAILSAAIKIINGDANGSLNPTAVDAKLSFLKNAAIKSKKEGEKFTKIKMALGGAITQCIPEGLSRADIDNPNHQKGQEFLETPQGQLFTKIDSAMKEIREAPSLEEVQQAASSVASNFISGVFNSVFNPGTTPPQQ